VAESIFRGKHSCKREHFGSGKNYSFLGAKSTSILDCVSWSVRWSVGWSVPTMQLRGKLNTSRLIREEREEEENWLRGKIVTSRLIREEGEEEENWLRRDSFAPRD
jgi:hypothetical protein